jgi:hypothetical protein
MYYFLTKFYVTTKKYNYGSVPVITVQINIVLSLCQRPYNKGSNSQTNTIVPIPVSFMPMFHFHISAVIKASVPLVPKKKQTNGPM